MAKVTTELRKSILKIIPTFTFKSVFSDLRLNKTAVGVKIVGVYFTQKTVTLIRKDMESKGFVFKSASINQGNGYNSHYFRGTRFTFMKPNN